MAVALVSSPAPSGEKPRPDSIKLGRETYEALSREEVRAAGLPWDDVPAQENAATWYVRGAQALDALEEDSIARSQMDHARLNTWDDGMKELAARLEAAREALDLFRRGSALERCQFPYFVSNAFRLPFHYPLTRKARDASSLLAAHARSLEAKGALAEAIDDYIAILRIARHCANGGLVSFDLGEGRLCCRLGADASLRGVYRREYPAAELDRYLGALARLEGKLPDLSLAGRAEKAWAVSLARRALSPETLGLTSFGGPVSPGGMVLLDSPLHRRVFRIIFPDRTIVDDIGRLHDRARAAMAKPFHEGVVSEADLLVGAKPWDFPLANFAIPLFNLQLEVADLRTDLALLRLGVGLRRYRAGFGSYPATLEGLVERRILERLPVDPFSGKSFFYRVKDGEFVVYSVGPDGKDGGGVFAAQGRGAALDRGFRSDLEPPAAYERPAKEDDSEEEGPVQGEEQEDEN